MLWRWLLTAIPGLLAHANASLGMIVSDESSGILSQEYEHILLLFVSVTIWVWGTDLGLSYYVQ